MLFDRLALAKLPSETVGEDGKVTINNPGEEIIAPEVKKEGEVKEEPEEIIEDIKGEPEDEPTKEHEEVVEEEPESEEVSFKPIVEALADADILFYDPEKEYSDDESGFQEVVKDTVNRGIEDYKNSFSEETRKAIELLESGVKLATLAKIDEQVKYAEVPLEFVENQKLLIQDYLSTEDWAPEEIEEELQSLEDKGGDKLRKFAEKAQTNLAKRQKLSDDQAIEQDKAQAAEIQKRQDERRQELELSVTKTKEIAGIKLSDKEHKELIDSIFRPSKKGDKVADKVKIAYYRLVNDDPELALNAAYFAKRNFKFDDIEKGVATKLTKTFKKEISKFKDTNAVSKNTPDVKPEDKTSLSLKNTFFGKNR